MIPVLFVDPKSNYLQDPDFDCYTIDRDAMKCIIDRPAIYHPPCRLFSKMKAFSTAGKCEKFFGYYSIMSARKYGGVVEHPKGSSLFKEMGCDMSGKLDQYGGFIRSVDLSWFGFPAQKTTYLYIVGIRPVDVPSLPLSLDASTHIISSSYKRSPKKHLPKSIRSITPKPMLEWLKSLLTCHQHADRLL